MNELLETQLSTLKQSYTTFKLDQWNLLSVVPSLQTVDISEMNFYCNYLITYSHTNSVFSYMCASRKNTEDFANCFTWHNLVQKDKPPLIKIGQRLLLENLSEFKLRLSQYFFLTVLYEVMFKLFMAGNSKGSHFEIFGKIIVRVNAVQIFPNFPAKSLSIYRESFLMTPF